MGAKKGALFLIKVGDGTGPPENFNTLGGLRSTGFTINNDPIDVTNKDSNYMRELLDGGSIQNMSMSGSGVFMDDSVHETVRAQAAARSLNTYQIIDEDGDTWQGEFLITSYERSGEHAGEEVYSLTLESSGVITYTGA